MEAIANRQSALVHAFLRGNELQRGVSPKTNGDEGAGTDGVDDDARSISLDLGNGTEGANQYQQQEEELARSYRLHLNVEKIRIPEVWFQPSIAGVDCAGIAELAGYMLNSFGEEDKKRMMQVRMAIVNEICDSLLMLSLFANTVHLRDGRMFADTKHQGSPGARPDVRSSFPCASQCHHRQRHPGRLANRSGMANGPSTERMARYGSLGTHRGS